VLSTSAIFFFSPTSTALPPSSHQFINLHFELFPIKILRRLESQSKLFDFDFIQLTIRSNFYSALHFRPLVCTILAVWVYFASQILVLSATSNNTALATPGAAMAARAPHAADIAHMLVSFASHPTALCPNALCDPTRMNPCTPVLSVSPFATTPTARLSFAHSGRA
jgi:hypothetical protein